MAIGILKQWDEAASLGEDTSNHISFYCMFSITAFQFTSSTVSACPDGFYGENCLHQCICRNGGTCDHVTGHCACPKGWTGLACEQGGSINCIMRQTTHTVTIHMINFLGIQSHDQQWENCKCHSSQVLLERLVQFNPNVALALREGEQ